MYIQKFNLIIISNLRVNNLYSGLDGLFNAQYSNYIQISQSYFYNITAVRMSSFGSFQTNNTIVIQNSTFDLF